MVTYEDVATVVEYSEERGYVPESTAKTLLDAVKIGREQGLILTTLRNIFY